MKNPDSNSNRSIASGRTSLKSLLTLASGAASLGAIDPSAQAALIATTFATPKTVGYGSGQLTSFNIDLPGDANLQFARSAPASSSNLVLAAQTNGYVRVGRQSDVRSADVGGSKVAFRTNAGATWNNAGRINAINSSSGNIIRSTSSQIAGPGAFSDKYLLFTFKNSLNADQLQYGWVGMSAATITAGEYTKISVTLTGWAYDDTGATIKAGDGLLAVPEPTNAGLLVVAMVVGGSALRQRRKPQPAASGQAN